MTYFTRFFKSIYIAIKSKDNTNLNRDSYQNTQIKLKEMTIQKFQPKENNTWDNIDFGFNLHSYPELNMAWIHECGYSRAIDYLASKNPLINVFISEMETYISTSRGLNQIYSYLYRIPFLGQSSLAELNNLHFKEGMISEAFLNGIPFLVISAAAKNNIPVPILEGFHLTYHSVMESHFQLLYAWWTDRLHDYSSIHFTLNKWTPKNLEVINEIKAGCLESLNDVIEDRNKVYKELYRLSVLKEKYEEGHLLREMLEKMAENFKRRYFVYNGTSLDCFKQVHRERGLPFPFPDQSPCTSFDSSPNIL